MAAAAAAAGTAETSPAAPALGGGRWRLAVRVPAAELDDIVPAARLVAAAAAGASTPAAYDAAKASFVTGVQRAALASRGLADALSAARAATPAAPHRATTPSASPLPNLQDVRGSWSGTLQAYGGGGGASVVDFDVRGTGWRTARDAPLADTVVARGCAHSDEGLRLDEAGFRAGDASLAVRGSLLGASQDARLVLTDFPAATLGRALAAAVPAAARATAADGGGGTSTPPSSAPPSTAAVDRLASALGLTRPLAALRQGVLGVSAPPDGAPPPSPVDGLLYVQASIGGSAAAPTGDVLVRLYDGALGATRLATAEASATLGADGRLDFAGAVVPAPPGAGGGGVAGGGHVRAAGSIPLLAPSGDATTPTDDAVSIDASVKDGGMSLVAGLVPGARWLGGSADVRVSARGSSSAPDVAGAARLTRGGLALPFLRSPATGIDADVELEGGVLHVRGVTARVGRRGRVAARGALPLTRKVAAGTTDGLTIELDAVDVRARPLYSGLVDAALTVRRGGGAAQPTLGGNVRLSRGVLSLLPPPADDATGGGSGDNTSSSLSPPPALPDVLKASADAAAAAAAGVPPPTTPSTLSQPSARLPVALRGLDVRLGPELRAVYPFVVNVGLSGELRVDAGSPTPTPRLTGAVALDSGEVNLLATQLVLDREHANRVVFDGGASLDPSLDVALRGAGVRAAIVGRASSWRQGLTLTGAGGGGAAGSGAAGAPELAADDAARVFEAALARAVVADDGRLALPALAAAAANSIMPKIQTQGALGQARWRLVSAPAVPGLLSLDPAAAASLLESLAAGTEVEVQFGRSLRASLARPLRDAERGPPAYTLTYGVTKRLRVQFSVGAGGTGPRALVFQYSSDV